MSFRCSICGAPEVVVDRDCKVCRLEADLVDAHDTINSLETRLGLLQGIEAENADLKADAEENDTLRTALKAQVAENAKLLEVVEMARESVGIGSDGKIKF